MVIDAILFITLVFLINAMLFKGPFSTPRSSMCYLMWLGVFADFDLLVVYQPENLTKPIMGLFAWVNIVQCDENWIVIVIFDIFLMYAYNS